MISELISRSAVALVFALLGSIPGFMLWAPLSLKARRVKVRVCDLFALVFLIALVVASVVNIFGESDIQDAIANLAALGVVTFSSWYWCLRALEIVGSHFWSRLGWLLLGIPLLFLSPYVAMLNVAVILTGLNTRPQPDLFEEAIAVIVAGIGFSIALLTFRFSMATSEL